MIKHNFFDEDQQQKMPQNLGNKKLSVERTLNCLQKDNNLVTKKCFQIGFEFFRNISFIKKNVERVSKTENSLKN